MNKKKKILVIANYFYPDVASLGQLITDFCFELKDKYNIQVIASIPNYSSDLEIDDKLAKRKYYDEKINGIKVRRIVVPNVDKKNKISRIKYIITYFINTIFAINNIKEYDIIFTVSQPPVLGGLLGKYAKLKNKKARLIYNIQDFNPEQIEAVKYSKMKIILKLMRFFDTSTMRSSDKILLVGKDQVDTLRKRDAKLVNKSIVINNWTDDEKIVPLDKNNEEIIKFKKENNIEDKFIIMYSGNIGLFYDLENLIKVMSKFKDNKDILFLFIGEGAVKEELIKYSKNNDFNNIKFLPYQPKERLNISLNLADIHLVVNAKGIKGVSVPSKIYGVMAAGKPILGVLEKGSEARNIIENANCGICVNPEDYNEFEKVIKYFIEINDKKKNEFERNSREYLEKNLSKRKSIESYDKLFETL